MFKERVALITGAGSGIGRKTALSFAEKGAAVVISDVDKEGLQKTSGMLRELGGISIEVVADITDQKQVEKLIQSAIDEYGRLDAACNNAGIGGEMVPTADYSIKEWDKVLNVNLKGQWLCMREEIHAMKKGGKGAIVNVSSILGNVGFAHAAAYVASKHGLQGLTKSAALEYSAGGIRVNCIAPAFIETEMLEKAGLTTDPQMKQSLIDLHPIGRLGRPEEVADAIVWLCSDEASYITGHMLLVDGGYTAR